MSRDRVGSGVVVGWLAASLAFAGPEHPARPVLLAVIVDASGSLNRSDLDSMRRLTLGVLENLPAASEAAVFAFADQSRLVQPRSAVADDVREALDGIRISGRRTALHDALYDATRYLREAPPGRKAILLLTDGHDEGSVLTLEDGLRLAEDLAIPVFAVGMGRVDERVLKRIAKLTSGDYLPARRAGPERLAAGILTQTAAQPAVRETPGSAPPGPARTSVTAQPATQPEPAGPVSRVRALGRVWTALALGLLAALGLATLLAFRRRSPARDLPRAEPDSDEHPTQRATLVSPTVLSRLSSTEEYLERTVVLRDDHVLALTRGPGAGAQFPVSGTSAISLGRSKANDVVLEDLAISSQHCRIRPTPDGGFMLHDLKSTNGTFLNERRVTQQALAEGDVIRLGETHLQFRRDQKRGE